MMERITSKRILSMTLGVLLVTSTFAFGGFAFNVKSADAQAVSLIVTAANPTFQNHFFGPQMVGIIINDPGADDKTETTGSLFVKSTSIPRVHLSDGLWYAIIAERDAALILIDLLTDGTRDFDIDVQNTGDVTLPPGSPYSATTGAPTSFVRDITTDTSGNIFVEVNQKVDADGPGGIPDEGAGTGILPTLPLPFFDAANPDVELSDNDDGGATDTAAECTGAGSTFDVAADGVTNDQGVCDWPYIRLFNLSENDVVDIRAGSSAIVNLTYKDFESSITAKVDRTAAYPVDGSINLEITDFMWNINPIEEDTLTFVINRETGATERIIYNPIRDFSSGSPVIANADFKTIFQPLSQVDSEFDTRQQLELNAPQGVESLQYVWFFNADAVPPTVVSFSPIAGAVFNADLAFTPSQADGPPIIGAWTPGVDHPAIRMFEKDPNTSVFTTLDERQGTRSNIFAGVRDTSASFDYFDIINTVNMKIHDGFSTVNAEVYNSADRAIFTVNDQDLNLRSTVSETLDPLEAHNFIGVGDPIPLINTRTSGIFDTTLNNVARIWVADSIDDASSASPGDVPGINGVVPGPPSDGGPGLFARADVDNDDAIDDEIVPGTGTETFEAQATVTLPGPPVVTYTNIVPATLLSSDNNFAAMKFAAPLIGSPPAVPLVNPDTIVIDTTLSLADIADTVNRTMTGQEIIDQIKIDAREDGYVFSSIPGSDWTENFLLNTAKIIDPAGGVLGRNATISSTTVYKVVIPKYNLIQLDTRRMSFTSTPDSFLLQIQVIHDACDTTVAATAFSEDIDGGGPGTDACVVGVATNGVGGAVVGATQIIDFNPFEKADTDGDSTTTGLVPVGTNDDGYVGIIDPLTKDPIGPAPDITSSTGYNRQVTSDRIALGSFRVLDLVDVLKEAHVDPKDTFIRFILIPLDDSVPPVPANVISGPQILGLDIMGINLLQIDADPAAQGVNHGVESASSFAATIPIGILQNEMVLDTQATFANMIYRLELEEESANSSIFTGRADFMTVTQFDTVQDVLQGLAVLNGDPIKVWLPNRFIPPNRLAFDYLDRDIVDFMRTSSATFIYETTDGDIQWDRTSYSFGQDAIATLVDEDLNRRPDSTERYSLPVDGFIYLQLGKEDVVDMPFVATVDQTFLETGPDTGQFVAQITMPTTILVLDATSGAEVTRQTNINDLEINYLDVRDRSSITQEFDSIANIRSQIGDVVLDRAAYPPGAIMYIEIHDNDHNTDVDIRENLDITQLVVTQKDRSGLTITARGGTLPAFPDNLKIAEIRGKTDASAIPVTVPNTATDVAPTIKIEVFTREGQLIYTMLPTEVMGGTKTPTFAPGFGSGVEFASIDNVFPILDRNGNPVKFAKETGPNTGIFEFEVQHLGPARDVLFPFDLPSELRVGTVDEPVIISNLPIQVTYTDSADEQGEVDTDEELATFLTNTARLSSDRPEYGLGDPATLIVEEPDFNRDSRAIDEVDFSFLDIITDKVDTEDDDQTNFGTVIADLKRAGVRTNLTKFRESDFNSGVFAVMIEELKEELADRGEDVTLIYNDKTPSGSGSLIRIAYEFRIIEILPEIIFDKEEYTPFDEVTVSIVSPDSNEDPSRLESIRIRFSSSSQSLGIITISETQPNSGIFQDDFDLFPARGVRDLEAQREDGVTVEFRIDEDTVVTKSVFVNFHVGQAMMDKDSFSLSDRAVLRVIDPDENRNPDTIDTVEVRFWSTTDRGGLLVTLRETGDRTGVFEEIATFTTDEESTGTRLRVSEGDTITMKYSDQTLPAPAKLAADRLTTLEVQELFASAMIGSLVPQLEKGVASEPQLVDQAGVKLDTINVGSQVLIQSEITNKQTKSQPFAYIVQIKDENGVITSLSWVTGEIPAEQSLKAAQSWIPTAPGTYTIEIFVWESVEEPTPISPVRTITATVSA